jgi:DNA-binding IclR family transcriptional regulator
VFRDGKTKRYTPGVTLLELGRAAYARVDWKDLARPVMETLMEKTQESVFLGTRNGRHVSILEIVESGQDLKITAPVGTRIPLMAGATGKVILASMEEAEARGLVRAGKLTRYTDNTVTDPDRYLDELGTVRRTGYAVDDEEYLSGVRAVAAPIPGESRLPSAIWVVGFTARITGEKMKFMAEETKAAAAAISRAIETRGTA